MWQRARSSRANRAELLDLDLLAHDLLECGAQLAQNLTLELVQGLLRGRDARECVAVQHAMEVPRRAEPKRPRAAAHPWPAGIRRTACLGTRGVPSAHTQASSHDPPRVATLEDSAYALTSAVRGTRSRWFVKVPLTVPSAPHT